MTPTKSLDQFLFVLEKLTGLTPYDLGGNVGPTLLSDGRVLFSAGQRGAFALMAISWSGENLNPFYGSHDGMVSQLAAAELTYTRWPSSIPRVFASSGWMYSVQVSLPLTRRWLLCIQPSVRL